MHVIDLLRRDSGTICSIVEEITHKRYTSFLDKVTLKVILRDAARLYKDLPSDTAQFDRCIVAALYLEGSGHYTDAIESLSHEVNQRYTRVENAALLCEALGMDIRGHLLAEDLAESVAEEIKTRDILDVFIVTPFPSSEQPHHALSSEVKKQLDQLIGNRYIQAMLEMHGQIVNLDSNLEERGRILKTWRFLSAGPFHSYNTIPTELYSLVKDDPSIIWDNDNISGFNHIDLVKAVAYDAFMTLTNKVTFNHLLRGPTTYEIHEFSKQFNFRFERKQDILIATYAGFLYNAVIESSYSLCEPHSDEYQYLSSPIESYEDRFGIQKRDVEQLRKPLGAILYSLEEVMNGSSEFSLPPTAGEKSIIRQNINALRERYNLPWK